MRNTRLTRLTMIAACGLALAPVARAADAPAAMRLGYDHADLAYRFDDGGGDGFELSGSWAVGDRYHLRVGFADLDTARDVSIAGGIHPTVAADTDLIAELALVHRDFDRGGSDDGFGMRFGARHAFDGRTDGEAALAYDDVSRRSTLELTGRYRVAGSTALTGGLRAGSGSTALLLGVRVDY